MRESRGVPTKAVIFFSSLSAVFAMIGLWLLAVFFFRFGKGAVLSVCPSRLGW